MTFGRAERDGAPVMEVRAYCRCGAWLEADLPGTSGELARGLDEVFWVAHSGLGHGKAGPEVAHRARTQQEREWSALWAG